MRQHTMFKRLLSGALALSLALTLAPAAAAAELSDVPAGAWYAKAVNYCHERELLRAGEDGLFAPEEPLTRSMVAHALYLLADRPEVDLTPEEFESGEEAKQLLADAGYPDGEGLPSITYTTNDAGNNKVVAEYLQQA